MRGRWAGKGFRSSSGKWKVSWMSVDGGVKDGLEGSMSMGAYDKAGL